MTTCLNVEDLDVRYGKAQVLFNVSATFATGEVTAVLGRNGAGKSTLARAVAGLVEVHAGRILFHDRSLVGMAPERVRKLGLCYVPEERGIFPRLSVLDNLEMAVQLRPRRDRAEALSAVFDLFPALATRQTQLARSLSGGEQQMLSVARVFADPPKLVVFDELSLGLAPGLADAVFERAGQLRDLGVTMILIEQFVHRALGLSDACIVLDNGSVAYAGRVTATTEALVSQYFGDETAAAPAGGEQPLNAALDPTSSAATF